MFKLLWRVARAVAFTLAAVVIAIEEWGWRPLTAWAARWSRWPPLARLEERIRNAPPRVAIALFLVPAVLLFPVKVLALWFIHIGRATLGVVVIAMGRECNTPERRGAGAGSGCLQRRRPTVLSESAASSQNRARRPTVGRT